MTTREELIELLTSQPRTAEGIVDAILAKLSEDDPERVERAAIAFLQTWSDYATVDEQNATVQAALDAAGPVVVIVERDWTGQPESEALMADTEPTERETLALGWLSAELAQRADAWAGNAPDWFPEPPEWIELWKRALAETADRRREEPVSPAEIVAALNEADSYLSLVGYRKRNVVGDELAEELIGASGRCRALIRRIEGLMAVEADRAGR